MVVVNARTGKAKSCPICGSNNIGIEFEDQYLWCKEEGCDWSNC